MGLLAWQPIRAPRHIYRTRPRPTLSPYAGWDNRPLFELEREFHEEQQALPARLVITVGSEENSFMPNYRLDIEDFWEVLKSRRSRGLELTTHLLQGETHFSGTARSYVTGIKAAFSTQPGSAQDD